MIPIAKCPSCGREVPDDFYCCLYCEQLMHPEELEKYKTMLLRDMEQVYQIMHKRNMRYARNNDKMPKKEIKLLEKLNENIKCKALEEK